MSELRVNSIEKRSGNNVSMSDPLKLKSYTTTQRDALTSATGDTIYNSTTSKVQVYDGSSWVDLGSSLFTADYVVIAGGGSGGGSSAYHGGGGAGGYRTSYGSGNISGANSAVEASLTLVAGGGVTYTVSI